MAIAPGYNSPIYQKRPYLIYLELAEACVSGCAQLITISLMGLLLYCAFCAKHRMRMAKDGLSPTMYLYMAIHLVGSVASLPYSVYLVGWWTHRGNNYSPQPLFWTGLVHITYMSTSCIPVFFVMLERCLATKLGLMMRYPHLPKWLAGIAASAFCSAVVGLFAIAIVEELPLPAADSSGCRSNPCLMPKTRSLPTLMVKGVVGSMNLTLAFYFFYLLGQVGSGHADRMRNRLVKYLMVFEIIFSIIPFFSAIVFNLIVGEPAANYFGTYAIMLACVDAAVCSVYYSSRLLRWKVTSRGATTN